jgi:cell division transport system permease protein
MAVIEAQLNGLPQVKDVYYQKNLLDAIHENMKRIAFVLGVFSMLLLFIAVALINNTIRLSVYSRRFIINTMQLVGATRGFIRKPFLLKSVLHGLAGATLAIVLLSMFIYLLSNEINGVLGFSNTLMISLLFLMVIILGIIITWMSTFFAVNKYLRLKTDQLYY